MGRKGSVPLDAGLSLLPPPSCRRPPLTHQSDNHGETVDAKDALDLKHNTSVQQRRGGICVVVDSYDTDQDYDDYDEDNNCDNVVYNNYEDEFSSSAAVDCAVSLNRSRTTDTSSKSVAIRQRSRQVSVLQKILKFGTSTLRGKVKFEKSSDNDYRPVSRGAAGEMGKILQSNSESSATG